MWPFPKNLAFVVLVPGSVAVFLPVTMFARQSFSVEGVRILGLVPLVLGASCLLWCVYDFGRSGHGTPAPIDPPKTLVVKGLYNYIRNPMYAGVLAVLVGEAVGFASWSLFAYAICAGLLFHGFVIFYEEPTLTRTYGQPYDDYRRFVPRWVPSVGRILRRRKSGK
jgi:protein-S-isoprenylcysteine O-methyltransferase Ste14